MAFEILKLNFRIDDRGDGVYILLVFNVTEEDNSKYLCVLVNSEERLISKAELYVVQKKGILFELSDLILTQVIFWLN